ncbi:MAG: transcriptional repressor NrdR [Clostridia bacterium]|nr:transcriptional repressor NrdR [Clostridia bacterium]
MKCPYCNSEDTKVIDSRSADEGVRIRRRRECFSCFQRFTTYETVETMPIMVIKRNRGREPYNRMKLTNGILRACEKRDISIDQIDAIVDQVEAKIENSFEREVSSKNIGEYTLEVLRNVDEVAYVRFASVYKQFKDIHSFLEELNRLISEK